MAKKDNGAPPDSIDANARYTTSDEDKAKAAKWFTRARDLGDKRQFDYAIEYYVNGLEFWPDAVEDACKPLHGCAVARRQTGGKKPGLKDTMKRSMTDKDARKAFLNSLWLFGHDPENIGFIDGAAKAASRLRADDAAHWAAGAYFKALESYPKANTKQFDGLVSLLEEIGDRATEREESTFGVNVYQMAIEVLNLWRRRIPKEQSIDKLLKEVSTKLTILKGKYKDGGSFRESIVDREEQEDRHDEQRSVQSDDRVDQLIEKAEAEFQNDPDAAGALNRLVDLLCRREYEQDELKAIGLLVSEYKRTNDYRKKMTADDVRMKQLGRMRRELAKAGDASKLKEHEISRLRFELNVFKERLERYPTDNRIRYEYAVRNFQAGRFDAAIPLFQTARSDPKNRFGCLTYLGRCFFRKGYHSQAVAAFNEAIEAYEFPDDDLGKSMHYWLARTHEGAGQATEARDTYGKILQMDYNYRDVRARMDGLPA